MPILESTGILSPADGPALALYCGAHSRLVEANADIRLCGLYFNTDLGGTKANPAVAVARAAESIMLRVLAEFGLTPASRQRLGLDADPPRDELGEFLTGRKS